MDFLLEEFLVVFDGGILVADLVLQFGLVQFVVLDMLVEDLVFFDKKLIGVP